MPAFNENNPVNFDGTAAVSGTGSSWWALFWTIVIFLLILAVTLWVIRRLNRSAVRGLSSPWIRVLDRQLLGGQQMLYLVEIAGKLRILGGTDHYLTQIAEIDDVHAAAEILEEIANRPAPKAEGVVFNLLQRMFGSRRKMNSFSAELQRMLEDQDHVEKQ